MGKEYLEQIAEIEAAKKFGEKIGLIFDGAFSKVDLSEHNSFFSVTAAFRNEMKIAFYSQDTPYQLYSRKEYALQKAEILNRKYDVLVGELEAVGSSSCQISRSLLEADPERRLYVVLHEALHIFIRHNKINIPLCLEEPIGDYVAYKAALEFCVNNQELADKIVAAENDFKKFCAFINKYFKKLSEYYQQGGKERERIFREAREEAKTSSTDLRVNRQLKYGARVNNAYFLNSIDYTRHDALVSEVFEREKTSVQEYLANPEKINKILVGEAND